MSPYISQDKRDEVKCTEIIDTPAKLAYVIMQAAMDCLGTMGAGTPNWDTLSNVHKAMVCAEREFYRRHIAPHEDAAIARNGDVF